MAIFILHLETSTRVCSVGLSKDGRIIACKELEEDGYAHGENLTVFVEEVLRKASCSLKELSAVSVASGPGSYTGLRIGAATAKALCYSLKIPLIAIDALSSLVDLAREKYPSQTICAVIDARRMEVYNLIADENGKHLKPISADIVDQSTYEEFLPFVCVGDGTSKLSEVWGNRAVVLDASLKSSARGQATLAFTKFIAKDFEDVAYWEPFYLKDFIAGTPKPQGL